MNDQKGFSPLMIIFIVIFIGAIGFASWYVWNKNQTPKITSYKECTEQSDAIIQESSPEKCVVNGQTFTNPNQKISKPETSSPAVNTSSDWVSYQDPKHGVAFSYPEAWGKPTKTDRTDVYYFEAFDKTSIPSSDNNVELASNTGQQDFRNGTGRGGALWDAVGYKQENGNYYLVIKYITDSGLYNGTTPVSNAEIIKGLNTNVLFGKFNYFETDYNFITVNTNGDYYGFMILTKSTNQNNVNQLKEVAKTIKLI